MSAETVETVLTRALNDADFAESLFKNAEEALAGYDLTKEEVEGFKNMSRESLEGYATHSLEERKSMSFLKFTNVNKFTDHDGPITKGPK